MLILWANLDIRPERREFMERQLEEYGLSDQAHRIAAVDGYKLTDIPTSFPPGDWDPPKSDWNGDPLPSGPHEMGTSSSMCIAISIAKWYQQPYFLYLEDDCILFDRFDEFVELHMKKLPDDWDVLSFGAISNEPTEPVNKLIAKPVSKQTWFAHCVLFRDTAYDKILSRMGTGRIYGADVMLVSAPDLNFYCLNNVYLPQKAGYSDTVQQYVGENSGRHNINEE
jgi:GR25 family glycosyltransferase involved in LPS biosynthesis